MQPDVCRKCRNNWRCIVKWGTKCNRNGGNKIPRFRVGKKEEKGLYVVIAAPGEEIRVLKNPWITRGSVLDNDI